MPPGAGAAGEARGGRDLCLTVLAAVFAGCHAALADERAREVALVEEAGCGCDGIFYLCTMHGLIFANDL